MLAVRLLGQFDVRRDDTPVAIPSRAAQSLLAYLLLTAGTTHRREQLAGLFWPETTDDKARRNLRHELWRLRQALETKSPRKKSASYLMVDEISIGFDATSDYWLDVAQVNKALPKPGSADQLIETLSLYRGELLPGWYDEWVVLERERVQAVFEQKMARLLELLVADRRWSEVLEWGERWIAMGQTPEPAYRALMVAHRANGNVSQVVSVYERGIRALREDLGVEPSEQTRSLFERLSKNEFVPPPAPGPSLPLRETRDEPIAEPAARPRALPVPLTSFIGREREIGQVKDLLSTTRLLTLFGAGGVGKTRLAIRLAGELADRYKDGARWVDLVPVADPALVPQAVARAMGVLEVPNVPLIETLANALCSMQVLLVLDNCEHLIAASAQLAQSLLGACASLKILATSREALGVSGETIWHVPSLSLPAPEHGSNIEDLDRCESVRLFVERARAVQTDFTLTPQNAWSIVQICRRLDGIPLAIELAAARVKLLSPREIESRLDERFQLLTTGSRTALARQQTLRAAIDWSFDLLAEPERILFRRLAVFAGGFTLQATEQVCAGNGIARTAILQGLAHLVDKSLVDVDARSIGGETRYRMLETIREYAREKLMESGDNRRAGDLHMEFFTRLAIDAEPKLLGDGTMLWVRRLEAEHDNLLAAMDWSLKTENADFALQIVGALMAWDVWHTREGAERSWQVVQSPLTQRRTPLRAKALNTAGVMQWFQGNLAQAHIFLEEAAAIGKETGNKENLVWTLAHLANVVAAEGDYGTARVYLEEGLDEARQLGARGTAAVGFLLAFLGDVFILLGDRERARQMYEESAARLRELNNRNFLAYPLRRLAEFALDRAEYDTATALCQESLALNVEGGDQRAIAACLAGFAAIAAARGQALPSVRLYAAVESFLGTISTVLLLADREDYERNVATLRSQLDTAAFDAAWAEGRAMTLEQAMAYARKDPPATEGIDRSIL